MDCSCTCMAEDNPILLFASLGIVCGDLDAVFKFLSSERPERERPLPAAQQRRFAEVGVGP